MTKRGGEKTLGQIVIHFPLSQSMEPVALIRLGVTSETLTKNPICTHISQWVARKIVWLFSVSAS